MGGGGIMSANQLKQKLFFAKSLDQVKEVLKELIEVTYPKEGYEPYEDWCRECIDDWGDRE